MCGISGVIERNSSVSFDLNESHFDFISPRGPDGFGSWKTSLNGFNIHLLHTRLAVVDMSTNANQPMQDHLVDWVITYNGEVYNYLELRKELEGLGWQFGTSSDTEVLLKAWAQWGKDALSRLNGMFAFAVTNAKTGETWLVRDRFGVKPLIWSRTDSGGLVFSSSLAAVAQSVNADVNIDYCSIGLRYKVFEGFNEETSFNGVYSLEPGTWMKVVVQNGDLKIENGTWYSLAGAVSNKLESIKNKSNEDILAETYELLADSVRIRLRSDVPLAVSLSGGLDSTTISALAKTHVNDLHGFTYGGETAKCSEGPSVARFANDLDIKPHFIWPDYSPKELDLLLERTLVSQESPFPGLSVMAQNEIYRNVRKSGFKVLLGGQGADEIFAGYRKFFIVATRSALSNHDRLGAARLIYSLGIMLIHEASSANLYLQSVNRYRQNPSSSFKLIDWPSHSVNLLGDSKSSLTDRQIQDIRRWSIPTLLRYEDRNSMSYGVESRLPFMDYRLVELALALPVHLKISNGFGKSALRQITNGIVPDYIRLNYKKRGFDVTQSWIADGLGNSLRERINNNIELLSPHIRKGININSLLSDKSLDANSNLLGEALMLAWLVNPIRSNAEKKEVF